MKEREREKLDENDFVTLFRMKFMFQESRDIQHTSRTTEKIFAQFSSVSDCVKT